jgi:hypothetical protein
MLDRTADADAQRTKEDEELAREMSDLNYRVKRIQEDLEFNSRGTQTASRANERRRLERELLSLMHERIPEVERKIKDREERKERERRQWARDRDNANERFGRYDNRDDYSRREDRNRPYSRGEDRDPIMVIVADPTPGETTGLLHEEKTGLTREVLVIERTETLENGVMIALVVLLQHAMRLVRLLLPLVPEEAHLPSNLKLHLHLHWRQ